MSTKTKKPAKTRTPKMSKSAARVEGAAGVCNADGRGAVARAGTHLDHRVPLQVGDGRSGERALFHRDGAEWIDRDRCRSRHARGQRAGLKSVRR